jgi:hypothetical protein
MSCNCNGSIAAPAMYVQVATGPCGCPGIRQASAPQPQLQYAIAGFVTHGAKPAPRPCNSLYAMSVPAMVMQQPQVQQAVNYSQGRSSGCGCR